MQVDKIEPLDCSNLAKEWPGFEMRFMVHLRREEMIFYQDEEKDEAAKENKKAEKERFRIGRSILRLGQVAKRYSGRFTQMSLTNSMDCSWRVF